MISVGQSISLFRAAVMAASVMAFFSTAVPAPAVAGEAWCRHHPRDARCHPHPPPPHRHVLPWCDRYHHDHCRHR